MNSVYLVNDGKQSKAKLPIQVRAQLRRGGKAIVTLGFQCENWLSDMNMWHRRASTHSSELTPFCLHLSLAPSTVSSLPNPVSLCVWKSSARSCCHTEAQIGSSFQIQRSTSILFSLKKRSTTELLSAEDCLPIKQTASFYISFCVSILFLIEVCLMRKKKKTSFAVNCGCNCLAQKLFCFENQSCMMLLSKSTVPAVDCTGIIYFLFQVGKNTRYVKLFKNAHGYFHWFISNRVKDIKHLRTVRHFTEHCHEGKFFETHIRLEWNAVLQIHTTNGAKMKS